MNSSDFFYENLYTALFFGLALIALVLAIVYWRTKPTFKNQPEQPRILGMYKPMFDHMKIVHGIRMNDDQILQLLDVADDIRGYTEIQRHMRAAKQELNTCMAERDEWKAASEGLQKVYDETNRKYLEQFNLRQAEEAKVLELKQQLDAAEKELDRGNEIIIGLKSDIDQALGVIKQQEEIIIALHTRKPGWNAAVAKRNPDGTFRKAAKGDHLEKLIGGKSVVMQRPVKHLREVNEELAKKQPRSILSLKPTEAIKVTNEAERDGILKLMAAKGVRWQDGELPLEFLPNKFPTEISINAYGSIIYKAGFRRNVLPASDFLPTDVNSNTTAQ